MHRQREGGHRNGFSYSLSPALEQLLTELEDFLKILDQENLSSTAVVRKSGLAELLRLYTKSSSECGPGAVGRSPWRGPNGCINEGHHNEVSQTGWREQQMFICVQLWRPEI